MNEVSIVLCGEAGQGIQTVGNLLSRLLKKSGYNVFLTREFMSRIRGGSNSTEIRVSDGKISTPVDRMDILIPLSSKAVSHVKKRITDRTVIMGEKDYITEDGRDKFEIPFTEIAEEIGSSIYANTVAVGTLAGIFQIDRKFMEEYIGDYFGDKESKIIENNIEAVNRGYNYGEKLVNNNIFDFTLKKSEKVKDSLFISGTEAVSMGSIAGGCNFICSYPMSPSTGVLVFLANQAKNFGIVVEQAEDEISAINMGLGAWYAGGRGMVTTSGGGFALMVEGLSLAGMIESPMVIHLAQRPGPATGLPTRTEQGDLLFSLYAGHGEFPRVLLAPGTPEEAFSLMVKAFDLADKYQIPVIVLTDQFLLDSSYLVYEDELDIPEKPPENHIVETDKDYRRYDITEDGVSPRGIPGYGNGLVAVDSDEHDEGGHITEDLDLRVNMVDKRLKKIKSLTEEAIPPVLSGTENYDTLIITWGSTYSAVEEAMKELDNDNLGHLHFPQVYPLHEETSKYFKKADKAIIVEGNATAQFAKILKVEEGIDIDMEILKYSGLQFNTEELIEKIDNSLNK